MERYLARKENGKSADRENGKTVKPQEESGITEFYVESQEQIRANEFYYKLWKCLKKALADEERLECHCNGIVVQLGKSIASGFTYYDPMYDSWCDYFLMSK